MRQAELKQILLEQAVSDNVDLVKGRRKKFVGRGRLFLRSLVRPLLLAVLVGVVASFYLMRQVVQETESTAVLGIDVGPSLPPGTTLVDLRREAKRRMLEALIFPSPRPVDRSVFPLRIRRVVLDPGHGGEHEGTESSSGIFEKELTLSIAKLLAERLEADGYEVTLTRTEDTTVDLEERVELANESRADLFLSIHLNSFRHPSIRGIETFYLGPSDDPYVTQLAAQENVESGYTLSDLRRLLDELYADVRQEESRRLAESVQKGLYSALAAGSPALRDRGVKMAPFVVLIATEMPAILVEVSSLSNPHDAQAMEKPEHLQLIADALAAGIREYADDLSSNRRGS